MKSEKHSGFGLWITGLPASGKSAVTAVLVAKLNPRGVRAVVLESDALRRFFPVQPSYDDRDRAYFYGSLAFIGKVLVDQGINVIFDATANRRSYRDVARLQIPTFLEVYVDTPLAVCMQRDPKGIYRKGQSGDATSVPGLQAEYEPPLHPDLVIRGDVEAPEGAAARILKLLNVRGLLPDAASDLRSLFKPHDKH